MTGALGFDPRAALARIQGDLPRPDVAGFSRLASLAAPTPSNSHSVASPGVGAEAPAPHDGWPEREAAPEPAEAELARELAAAAETVAEVLRTAPPAEDLAEMRAHYADPPTDRPYVPGDPDPLRDGLLLGALMRLPAWEGPTPPPGTWCSVCGRSDPKAGGRWWRPLHPRSDGLGVGPGWRCFTCHPPPPGCETKEVRT